MTQNRDRKAAKPLSRNDPAINVAIPNTTREKMSAIVELSQAVHQLAVALNGVNVAVHITDNWIECNDGTGINIGFEPV